MGKEQPCIAAYQPTIIIAYLPCGVYRGNPQIGVWVSVENRENLTFFGRVHRPTGELQDQLPVEKLIAQAVAQRVAHELTTAPEPQFLH